MAALLKVDNISTASNTGTANLTLNSDGSVSVPNTLAMGSSFKRNRIINGDMRVDQRATPYTGTDGYTVDRWKLVRSTDASESAAQNTDAPTGFSYSLRNTISVADTSIGAAQYSGFRQIIEGYNVADLGFGTSSAKTITISFWVKATQAGTYTVSLENSSVNRTCWKTFTVNNTSGVGWEYKTLTFNGDTTGTWLTTNGVGLYVDFWFAMGSSYQGGSDGVWSSSLYFGPTGTTNGIGTNGNIYAISGVQLETGSIATPYERQIYSDQLIQCQRYYFRYLAAANGYTNFGSGYATSTTNAYIQIKTPVTMRANPSSLELSAASTFNYNYGTSPTIVANVFDANLTVLQLTGTGMANGYAVPLFGNNNTGAYIGVSAEL